MPATRRNDRGSRGRAQHLTTRQQALESCHSSYFYRNRNVIGRMFGRLKDFWRIATRYDRSATNLMAAVHIVATVA